VNSLTLPSRPIGRTASTVGVGIAAAGAVAALLNRWLARRAERRNPPIGRFITVNGVRLHYVDRGAGIPVVLLHGNGSMIEDFKSSGLLDQAAKKYRVIAFDRPGFGHSERPRGIVWGPQAQAHLIAAALMEIGVSKPMVLGHSWGTLVAVALALQYPREVQALILASGYYFPSARADVAISFPAALPVIGDVLSHPCRLS
jgi:pimeloyl-ACP methyl ester carboxylesterase